jgi:hypothetical protein
MNRQPDKSPIINKNIEKYTMPIDDILLNLNIIAKINKNDKLYHITTDNLNVLKIDSSYSIVQSITRWYYGDNRDNTLQFIQIITNNAFKIVDDALTQKLKQDADNIFTMNLSELVQQFNLTFINCSKGINNLKITYSTDEYMISRLDIILDKIKIYIDNISKALQIKN